MSKQDVMSRQVWFSRGVPSLAVKEPRQRRTSLRWQKPIIIPHLCEYVRLIEGCPVPDSVPELSEADICICCEVQPAYYWHGFMLQPAIPLWSRRCNDKGRKRNTIVELGDLTPSFDLSNLHIHPRVPVGNPSGAM